MKHYFVKSHFSGWHEVNEEHFNSFVENFMHHASGMSENKKAEYIKTITRIEEDERE